MGKKIRFNLKGALFTSLAMVSVTRCPCCGNPICLNTLPFIGGAFFLGGLVGGRNKDSDKKGAPEGG